MSPVINLNNDVCLAIAGNYWKTSGIELFAGLAREEASTDGSASYFYFDGVSVEFDNVLYVCDKSVGSNKIIKELKEIAKFLGGLQSPTSQSMPSLSMKNTVLIP